MAETAEQLREAERRREAQVHADDAGCKSLQASFDRLFFQPYGLRCPPAVAGSNPHAYYLGLLGSVQQRLSSSDDRVIRGDDAGGGTYKVSDLARMPIDELPRSVLEVVEGAILRAARLQTARPHVSTLPPPGQFVERHETDQAGGKQVKFFGRESWIKSSSSYRPGRVVARLVHWRDGIGTVLAGRPFSRRMD
jgi:hypothetical protein